MNKLGVQKPLTVVPEVSADEMTCTYATQQGNLVGDVAVGAGGSTTARGAKNLADCVPLGGHLEAPEQVDCPWDDEHAGCSTAAAGWHLAGGGVGVGAVAPLPVGWDDVRCKAGTWRC